MNIARVIVKTVQDRMGTGILVRSLIPMVPGVVPIHLFNVMDVTLMVTRMVHVEMIDQIKDAIEY